MALTYKQNPIRLTTDFLSENREVRMQWNDIFKVLKEKYCQSRTIYPNELSNKQTKERH